jgi:hypothetical protein
MHGELANAVHPALRCCRGHIVCALLPRTLLLLRYPQYCRTRLRRRLRPLASRTPAADL